MSKRQRKRKSKQKPRPLNGPRVTAIVTDEVGAIKVMSDPAMKPGTMKLVKLQCLSHINEHGVTRRCQDDAGHDGFHWHRRVYDGGWQLWTWNNDYEIEYSSGGDD